MTPPSQSNSTLVAIARLEEQLKPIVEFIRRIEDGKCPWGLQHEAALADLRSTVRNHLDDHKEARQWTLRELIKALLPVLLGGTLGALLTRLCGG